MIQISAAPTQCGHVPLRLARPLSRIDPLGDAWEGRQEPASIRGGLLGGNAELVSERFDPHPVENACRKGATSFKTGVTKAADAVSKAGRVIRRSLKRK